MSANTEPRNLPELIRALGPPNHIRIMDAIADMMMPRTTTTERDKLLDEALILLTRATGYTKRWSY